MASRAAATGVPAAAIAAQCAPLPEGRTSATLLFPPRGHVATSSITDDVLFCTGSTGCCNSLSIWARKDATVSGSRALRTTQYPSRKKSLLSFHESTLLAARGRTRYVLSLAFIETFADFTSACNACRCFLYASLFARFSFFFANCALVASTSSHPSLHNFLKIFSIFKITSRSIYLFAFAFFHTNVFESINECTYIIIIIRMPICVKIVHKYIIFTYLLLSPVS